MATYRQAFRQGTREGAVTVARAACACQYRSRSARLQHFSVLLAQAELQGFDNTFVQ